MLYSVDAIDEFEATLYQVENDLKERGTNRSMMKYSNLILNFSYPQTRETEFHSHKFAPLLQGLLSSAFYDRPGRYPQD
jgi:hypothetical protein